MTDGSEAGKAGGLRAAIAGRRDDDRPLGGGAPERKRHERVGIAGEAEVDEGHAFLDEPIQAADQGQHLGDGLSCGVLGEYFPRADLGPGQESVSAAWRLADENCRHAGPVLYVRVRRIAG
jgi:hypothetical protein